MKIIIYHILVLLVVQEWGRMGSMRSRDIHGWQVKIYMRWQVEYDKLRWQVEMTSCFSIN